MGDPVWHALRPVGLEFAEKAEQVVVVDEDVGAPLADVWAAFADAPGWVRWFPGVEWARYDGAPPHGVGTIRRSRVAGVEYEETMLVWEPGRRWAYRVDRSTAPVARAQLEISDFAASIAGTRVRWTLAVDPLEKLTYMADGVPFRDFLANLFRDAMRGLERDLSRRG
jgi:hypothetical protein